MKSKLTLLFFCISSIVFSQELKLNPDTNKFEYIEVVDESRKIKTFEKRFTDLNYNSLDVKSNLIKGQGLINEQVMGFVVEIFYDATIEIKDSRYRIKISNVLVKDKMGTYILEDMGGFQKKWLKRFNKRLPEIIKNLKISVEEKPW